MDRKSYRTSTICHFAAIGLFTIVSCYLIFGMINVPQSNKALAIFWMIGFTVLTLNVGYMLVSTIAALITRKKPFLREAEPDTLPNTAIVYIARNENAEALKENLTSSFRNNFEENVDIWLLSNSDFSEYVKDEQKLSLELKKEFGGHRFNYFQTYDNPLRRKHVCISQWINANLRYKYFIVCDADTLLPFGSIRKLVCKAEHPENRKIALFQTHISIIKKATYFSQLLGLSQDICQKIYSKSNQNVFGGGVSYGSGCLIRSEAFRDIDVPEWVLSHDIWDTVFLEEKGYQVVFCGDVVTYGRYPANYLEYLRRTRRWIAGTLESIPICFKAKISPGTRFMVLYPSYMYAIQPLFFLWILSGFFYNNKLWEPMLVTQKFAFLGSSIVDLEMGSQLFFTMAVISGHRFTGCRSLKEARYVIVEFLTTMLLCLNGIVFDSVTVIKLLVFNKRGKAWVPMKKGPDQKLGIKEVAKELWPVAVLGVVILILGAIFNPLWTLFASPFIASFILGIPAAYWTGKRASVVI